MRSARLPQQMQCHSLHYTTGSLLLPHRVKTVQNKHIMTVDRSHSILPHSAHSMYVALSQQCTERQMRPTLTLYVQMQNNQLSCVF
jgi:hypothetical protein